MDSMQTGSQHHTFWLHFSTMKVNGDFHLFHLIHLFYIL